MKQFRKIHRQMMKTPHFVLFSRTGEPSTALGQGGDWYFRLESKAGGECLEASDFEPQASRERLELLAAIRGLEALDQPSTVTLITESRQIPRAIRQGLDYWRNRDWKWERYGEKVPMNNADLWQRIDRAMQIHDVRCRSYRIDQAHPVPDPHNRPRVPDVKPMKRESRSWRPLVAMARWTAGTLHHLANGLQRFIPDASPNPHPSL